MKGFKPLPPTNANKIKSGSVDLTCIYIGMLEQKPVVPPKKAPPRKISFVPIEDCSVPYIFTKGGATNIIKEAEKDAKPKKLLSGEQSHLVTIFKPDENLVKGGVYTFKGFYYTTFATEEVVTNEKGEHTKTSFRGESFECARIVPMSGHYDLEKALFAIPFERRSLDYARDVPGKGDTYPTNLPYRFLVIKVKQDTFDEPNTLYGTFSLPPRGDPKGFMFNKYDKVTGGFSTETTLALTGGTSVAGPVLDNQIPLRQNDKDGTTMVLGHCKLYSDSIDRFQLPDWPSLGPGLVEHAEGFAIALISREKSQNLGIAENGDFCGGVSLNVTFYPNMGIMAKRAGFKMSLPSVMKMFPNIASGKETPPSIALNATGINMMRYPFDPTTMAKCPFVDCYIVCNLGDLGKDKIENAKDEAEMVKICSDKKSFGQNEAVFSVFAVASGDFNLSVAFEMPDKNKKIKV